MNAIIILKKLEQDGRHMDKKIKQISQEIQRGKNLEANIPDLFNNMANRYENFAEIRLAMHYFTFYEAYYDDETSWTEESLGLIKKVNDIIGNQIINFKNGVDRENTIKEVDAIRKDIMKRMEALTTYADVFQIYEYVLNRLEYRFKKEAEYLDEEEFAKEVLRYIFDSEDNFVINEKIKEMIGQLPVRITKQKYFDLIEDSLKNYFGAEVSSLNSFLYMLRTSATLYQNDEGKNFYPVLWEKKEQLAQVDYKDITKEVYEKAINTLRAATFILETETTVYYGLQEIVNEAYAILLCKPYSGMVTSDSEKTASVKKAALTIIEEIHAVFKNNEKKDIIEDIMDQFTDLEGVQEELSFEVDSLESAFYEVTEHHTELTGSLMLETLMNVLKRTQSLLSNSLFIDFDEVKDNETVDETSIAKESQQLQEDLTKLFSGQDRLLTRAVMANTINKMPVFFKDHKEVMDYVRYSLERCSDLHEKIACAEIIKEIMYE